MNIRNILESWKKGRLQREREKLEDYLASLEQDKLTIDFSNKRLSRLGDSTKVGRGQYRKAYEDYLDRITRRGKKTPGIRDAYPYERFATDAVEKVPVDRLTYERGERLKDIKQQQRQARIDTVRRMVARRNRKKP